jgi:recombination protein RecA
MPSKAAEIAAELNKQLGSETVKLASDPSLQISYLRTGVLPMDVLLQGGLPRGRFVEIYGDYSTLKSYVALRAIATTQEAGGVCALVDTEHSFDPDWASSLGVDVGSLILQRPPTGEDAVDVSELLIRQDVDLLVWDSVAATLPQDEAKKRLAKENIQPARLAHLMSAASRRLTAANDKTAVLFINQTRLNVGQLFGDPTVVPGGKSLPFYASYRISLRKAGAVKKEIDVFQPGDEKGKVKKAKGKEVVAYKIKATVEKSKLSKPFRDTYLIYDLETARIDEVGFVIAHGLEQRWIEQTGVGTYKVGDQSVRGIDNLRGLIQSTPQLLEELTAKALGGEPEPVSKKVVRRRKKS